MLEGLAIVLLVINILLFLFAKLSSPNGTGTAVFSNGRSAPASLPYDVNDFCAYHSHIVLQSFEQGGARFIFDCKLPECDEPIDMIMLAKSGAYVFKHVKVAGWISGMENSEKWTQRVQMGYGRRPQEDKFDNPVMLVEDEVHKVRRFIDRDGLLVRSVVVFPDFCALNNIKVFNPNTRVVTLDQLLPSLVTLNNKTGTNITQHEINELYDEMIQYEIIPTDEAEQYEG
ncbi:MAG: NERD domain-containing protein [Eubacterium sp.]|nr:NERD domain-containing protein [Eubacterium sp.]